MHTSGSMNNNTRARYVLVMMTLSLSSIFAGTYWSRQASTATTKRKGGPSATRLAEIENPATWGAQPLMPLPAPTCAPTPTGLIDWFRAEGDGSDFVGANNGVLQGNATFTSGEVGQAFSVAGGSDTVTLPAAALHQALSAFTVDAWIYPTSSGQDTAFNSYGRTIFSNTDGDGFALRVRNGSIQADVRLTGGDVLQTFTQAQVPLNGWSHVALTYDGSLVVAYLNGNVVSSVSGFGSVRTAQNANTCAMIGNEPAGCAATANGFGWQGGIDEVQIFNRALTVSEVQAIYNAGSAGSCTSQGSPTPTPSVTPTPTPSPTSNCTAPTSGRIDLWSAEGNGNDSIGANNGTLQNGAAFNTGVVGQAFDFNSASATVTMPASALHTAFSALSIDAWVYPTSNGKDTTYNTYGRTIFSNTDNDGFAFRVKDGQLQVDIRTTTGDLLYAFSNNPLVVNTWSHVALTYDGSSVKAYVNGALVGTVGAAGTIRTSGNANTCAMIGNEPAGCAATGNGFGWVGRIDELELFSRALSATEVQAIYNIGSGSCSLYPTTTAVVSPSPTAAGWNNSDVTVTLNAVPGSGSGATITQITYSTSGAQVIPNTNVNGSSTLIPISTEGVTIVTFYATDSNGNSEPPRQLSVKIDKTPPTAAITNPVNTDYSLNQPVPANYSCGDSGPSGLATCAGPVPSGSNIDTASPGVNTFSVTATDNAGNTATQSVDYNVIAPACGTPPPSGIVAWYPGEGNADDIVAGDNGCLCNETPVVTGLVGQAFNFDGVGNAVKIPPPPCPYPESCPPPAVNDARHTTVSAFSVDAWVYPVDHAGFAPLGRTIISNTDGDGGWALRMTNGSLQADVHLTGGNIFQPFSATQLPLNAWSHVAMTYDGVALRGYLNGQLLGTISASGKVKNTDNAGECTFIGNEPDQICLVQFAGQSGGGGFGWKGNIDEVQVYNRALSAFEVQSIYNAGAAGNCRTGAMQFASATYSVLKGEGFATITVSRAGGDIGAVSVQYATGGGTAVVGQDYQATSGTLNFGNSEFQKTFTIPIIDNPDNVGGRTVGLTLSNAAGGAELGSPINATLNILNSVPCVSPPSGLIDWYKGEGNGNDTVGPNNGTLQNGASFGGGKVGQAFTFGNQSSAVTLPATGFHSGFSAFTIDAWVYPTSSGIDALYNTYGRTIFSNTDSDGFALRVKNGFLQADVRLTGGDVLQTFNQTPVPINAWSHVALVYDGSTIKTYLNGQILGSIGATGTVRTAGNANTCAMIGNEPNGCSATANGFGWLGSIDELDFFDRALTAAEIQAIYNSDNVGKCESQPGATPTPTPTPSPSPGGSCLTPPANLVGWLPGDGNVKEVITNNSATMVGGAAFSAGEVGQSFAFFGGSSSVVLPSTFYHNSYPALTIDTWVLPTSHGRDTVYNQYGRTILSNTDNDGFALRVLDGYLQVDLRTTGSNVLQTFNQAQLPLNTWSHVAVVYDGALIKGYLNGQLLGSIAASGPIRTAGNANTCAMVGNEPNVCQVTGNGFGWQGSIDEVDLFSRALSASEIQAIYNAGSGGKCKP